MDPRLEPAGIRVVCLEQDDVTTARSKLAFAAQAIWNGAARRALARELAACDPRDTLVHVHAFAKALSPSIGPAIRASGLPCLYTMHEFFLVCPTGGFYAYPEQRICHRTPMSAACIAAHCDARSYPRKVARMVRHAGLAHVARLPDLFAHVVTISDLQESVVRPLMPPGTVFHRVDNPIAVVQAPLRRARRATSCSSGGSPPRRARRSSRTRPSARGCGRSSSATAPSGPISRRAIPRPSCSAGATPPAYRR